MDIVKKVSEDLVRPLSAAERQAVERVERGIGSDAEVDTVRNMKIALRTKRQWLRCDCRDADAEAAALVTVARQPDGRLEWRTWRNGHSVPHESGCCFFDRTIQQLLSDTDRSARTRISSPYFRVLKKDKEPRQELSDHIRSKRATVTKKLPALATRLLQLIEAAGLNKRYPGQRTKGRQQKEQLRAALAGLKIAPGVLLDDLFFTENRYWSDGTVGAELAKAIFPEKIRPQAYVCFYTKEVDGHEARFGVGDPMECAAPVGRPSVGGQPIKGPYLVIGAVGFNSDDAVSCLKAYALPIARYDAFVPVDSNLEREALWELEKTLGVLQREFPQLSFELEKPLFVSDTPLGPCLPDFIISAASPSGWSKNFVIEVMGFDLDAYIDAKERTHTRMELLGPVLKMWGPGRSMDLEARDVTRSIRRFLKQAEPFTP